MVYLQQLAQSIGAPTETVPIKTNYGTRDADPDHRSALEVWDEFRKHHKISNLARRPATIWSDSQNALANAQTPFGWLSGKLRHIKTSFHFLKQYMLPNDLDAHVSLQAVSDSSSHRARVEGRHVRGDDNPADVLTKGFGDSSVKNSGRNMKMEVFTRHASFCLGRRGAAASV